MISLPDVNVLIALCDPLHPNHEAAHRWFEGAGARGFSTCATTENGLVRVLSHALFGSGGTSVSDAIEVLTSLRAHAAHRFIAEALSLADSDRFDPRRVHGAKQVTDVYLLGLAVEHGMRFATFDRRMNVAAVEGGATAIHQLPLA